MSENKINPLGDQDQKQRKRTLAEGERGLRTITRLTGIIVHARVKKIAIILKSR